MAGSGRNISPGRLWPSLALAAVLALSGCSTVSESLTTPYNPIPNIHDVPEGLEAQALQDVADCATWAKQSAQRKYDFKAALSDAGGGAARNLPSVAVPGTGLLGPILGGLGGVLTYSAEWSGLLHVDEAKATQACVRQKLDRDHAGILVEAPL